MAIKVKSAAEVAAKWAEQTPGRQAYYEAGVKGAGADWEANRAQHACLRCELSRTVVALLLSQRHCSPGQAMSTLLTARFRGIRPGQCGCISWVHQFAAATGPNCPKR